MKAQYNNQPVKLEAVGNGSWLWRWNILQIEVTDNNGTTRPAWTCEETTVWNEPTADKIKQAVIRENWDETKEAKLINDYNAAKENILPVDKIAAYHDFLIQRTALKQDVDNYFINK